MNEDIIGTIYLIQPAELVGTKRYKIGISNSNDLKRCKNGYKNGSRYLCICECINPPKLEKIIKNEFNIKFKLIAGHEYFEGNEMQIKLLFLQLFINYDISKNNIELENDINNNATSNIITTLDITNALIQQYSTDLITYFYNNLNENSLNVDILIYSFQVFIYIFEKLNFNFNLDYNSDINFTIYSFMINNKENNDIECHLLEIKHNTCNNNIYITTYITYDIFIYQFIDMIATINLKFNNYKLQLLLHYVEKYKNFICYKNIKNKIKNIFLNNYQQYLEKQTDNKKNKINFVSAIALCRHNSFKNIGIQFK